MKKLIFVLSFIGNFLIQSFCYAKTECPVDSCMDCGNDCLAYLTAIKDQNGQTVTLSNGQIAQKLAIIGTGRMTDFSLVKNTSYGHDYGSDAPWDQYFASIAAVDVSGVSNISSCAFLHFPQLSELNISNSVSEIGAHSFEYLPRLPQISLPNSVTTIGERAFSYNSHWTNITIPDSVTTIGAAVFASDGGLTNLYCSEQSKSLCEQALKESGFTNARIENVLKTYQKLNGQFFYQGKFYTNPRDIGTPNYMKKRIYTIDEANKITGKKNSVSIRYK